MKAAEMGSIVIKESLIRAGLKGEEVSEVIMGQVFNLYKFRNNRMHIFSNLSKFIN